MVRYTMSSSYVRKLSKQWAQAISAVVGNPQFYDTVNMDQRPTDAAWWTMDYYAEFYDGDTFCGPGFIETGFIRVVVLGQPGTGDLAAVEALEAIIPQMLAQVDPTQRLKITTVEPANEQSSGTADSYYRVGGVLNYKLDL